MTAPKRWVEHEKAIVEWLRSRPAVFGPYADRTTVWQEAYRSSGVKSGLWFFEFTLKRIGYSCEPFGSGFRLDLSDPALVEEA